MRGRGLGTPATRASIVETLLQRRYIERDKKALRVTDLGRLFLRNIAVCFDAYYAPESKRHSRTV